MAVPASSPPYQSSSSGRGVCGGIVRRQRAAAGQHHHHRLAGGHGGRDQLLLRFGQFQIGAVAARESGNGDAHLFAFQVRIQADKRHRHVAVLHGSTRFGQQWRRGRNPGNLHAAGAVPAAGTPRAACRRVRLPVGCAEMRAASSWSSRKSAWSGVRKPPPMREGVLARHRRAQRAAPVAPRSAKPRLHAGTGSRYGRGSTRESFGWP